MKIGYISVVDGKVNYRYINFESENVLLMYLFSIQTVFRIPAVQLIHGDKDIVVPDSSSMKMGKALWDMGCRNVQYSVIPQCDHYEICLDLMDPERAWHGVVMNEILRAVRFHL